MMKSRAVSLSLTHFDGVAMIRSLLKRSPEPPDQVTSILSSIAVPVVLLDGCGQVLWANPEAQEVVGEGACRGRSFANSCRSNFELAQTDQPLTLQLVTGQALEYELRPWGQNGWVLTFLDGSKLARVAELAQLDPLTGLANRRAFNERLKEEFARAKRNRSRLAVLCIDLDRFKLVNDTLGHPVGDALLVQVSEKLREASRENDFVARIGGDEFAIIQMDAQQPNAAHSLAHRLTELLGCPLMIGDHTLTIGVSVGVGIAPNNGQTPECLLKSADLALYRAKEDGRGVFRFFEPGMDEAMQTRRRLESDLRSAINKGDFELAFQPQVRVGTGTVVGFEALLRWQHPERGSVAPSDFLLVAEEAGLTAAIGAWVLRTACKEAAGWSSAVSVSVNLSPAQFREAGLIGMVVQALAYSGLEPQRLELEITEGALLGGFDETLCILRKFHALGVRVTVDDFGKGFSLLSYMPRFPFHKIKIDPSFVNDMDKPEARAIVRAIADLAANLGLTTTAEGVETIEQLAQVRSEGCTDAQGFLIGHPLSPTGVRHFLRSVPPGATQAA